MQEFRRVVREEFDLYLDRFVRALSRLDDRSVWQRVTPGMNSVANLVLHVEGNIRLFLGLGVAGIPYERDRGAEFERTDGLTVADLHERIEGVRALVHDTLGSVSDEVLDAPSELEDYASRREHVLHIVAHAGYHAGQAVLLSKLVSGDDAQLLDWGH